MCKIRKKATPSFKYSGVTIEARMRNMECSREDSRKPIMLAYRLVGVGGVWLRGRKPARERTREGGASSRFLYRYRSALSRLLNQHHHRFTHRGTQQAAADRCLMCVLLIVSQHVVIERGTKTPETPYIALREHKDAIPLGQASLSNLFRLLRIEGDDGQRQTPLFVLGETLDKDGSNKVLLRFGIGVPFAVNNSIVIYRVTEFGILCDLPLYIYEYYTYLNVDYTDTQVGTIVVQLLNPPPLSVMAILLVNSVSPSKLILPPFHNATAPLGKKQVHTQDDISHSHFLVWVDA